jgi:3-methyladenine DNA glycosylase AlkD
LRTIAKNWALRNIELGAAEFRDVVTSLIEGKSFTEKCLGGLLLDYARPDQRKFDIKIFDHWLSNLKGWAEVDALCTGKFQLKEMPENFKAWKPMLKRLSKSDMIEKRRASLVLFCSPIAHCPDEEMAATALSIIDTLKHEKEVLITKAISWLLRSMVKYHKQKVRDYLDDNKNELPAIAVRETLVKLKTGKKTKRKISG